MAENVSDDLRRTALLDLACRMRMPEQVGAEVAVANSRALSVQRESMTDRRRAGEWAVRQVRTRPLSGMAVGSTKSNALMRSVAIIKSLSPRS